MTAPLFELVSELQTTTRRDFPLADSTILAPLNANPLVEGEWLELNTSYQVARGAAGSGVHEGIVLAFPVHTERGRYDTQALGKTNIIMLGMYEADTQIVNTTSLNVGDLVTVQDVTVGSLTKRGLGAEGATSGRMIVGHVTKLFSGLQKIRFVHTGYQKR